MLLSLWLLLGGLWGLRIQTGYVKLVVPVGGGMKRLIVHVVLVGPVGHPSVMLLLLLGPVRRVQQCLRTIVLGHRQAHIDAVVHTLDLAKRKGEKDVKSISENVSLGIFSIKTRLSGGDKEYGPRRASGEEQYVLCLLRWLQMIIRINQLKRKRTRNCHRHNAVSSLE